MSDQQYNNDKKYMYDLKEKTNLAYTVLENSNTDNIVTHKDRKLLAQSN
jgi:hypothetical protein